MENTSLHTNGQVRSMNRTFIVEDCLKTNLDSGPKMKRLASKAALMMRDHVSGHETTLSVPRSPDPFKGRQVQRR